MASEAKSRRWKIEIALLGATGIMLVGILGAWGYAYNLNRTVERALVDSSETPSAEPAEEEKSAESQPETRGASGRSGSSGSVRTQLPEEIKKLVDARKFFGAPSTSVRVQGVLGNSALINNQWMEVGEEKKGIRLLEITDDKVIVEVLGKRRELSIWQALPGAAQAARPPQATANPAAAASEKPAETAPPERRGWRGGGFRGGGDRSQMRERMRQMMESGEFDPEMFNQFRGGRRGGGRRRRNNNESSDNNL